MSHGNGGLRIDGAWTTAGRGGPLRVGPEGRLASTERGAADDRVIDAAGLSVEPGFVDLQVNGGFGHHLTTDPGRIWDVGTRLAAHGVTSFLPTLLSPTVDELRVAAAVLAGGPPGGWTGARPLGLHLEGPALAPGFRGAHDRGRLAPPSASLVAEWLSVDAVRLVTLAPELSGALEAIARLDERGITVAIGHTGASEDRVRDAVDAGASMVTHLFNAMAPFHHRHPGVVGAVLVEDRLSVGLIADDVHVAREGLALAWRAAGPDRIVLTADAVAALGVAESPPRTPGGVLAGGSTPFFAVRGVFREAIGAARPVVSVTSTNACRVLGETDRGIVREGARGDLVLLDEQGRPVVTIVGGRVVHDPQRRTGEPNLWG